MRMEKERYTRELKAKVWGRRKEKAEGQTRNEKKIKGWKLCQEMSTIIVPAVDTMR
jgi:hypothetical protein